MKKNYLIALVALICSFASAQIEQTSYKGAFAPAPTAAWTDSWTTFDPQNAVYGTPNVDVTTNITTNTTWTANNIYYLKAQVYVKDGATLTIEPGTVVRGDSSNPSCALIVTKGSKLIANGTVNNPIVFTSDKAAGSRTSGDWGGLVLLGKGNYNKTSGLANIEGITISADTQYGGGATPDDTDNSGSLKYVRIEFPGYELAVDKEINGLTFGAVGSGTTVDYVQVSYSKDDAFEWFGGAVNCKHLVALASLDDDLDTDNGFSGKVQFCLVVRDPNRADKSNSEAFESDNNDSKTGATTDGNAGTPKTSATFSNCTLVGPNFRATLPNGLAVNAFHKGGAHIRRNTELKILNSVFMDFKEGLHVDNAYTEANATAGTMKFQNNILAGMTTNYKLNTGSTFDITTWAATNNNTTQVSSADLLTKAYDTDGLVYTGLDFRPAAPAAPAVVSATINYVVGNVANQLSATAASGNTLNWYTVATGGTASATAPTPTTAVAGTTTYYVSQTNVMGAESERTAITVNVESLLTVTSYRGAFAPAPTAAWTDSWTTFDPQNAVYGTPNVDVTTNITTNTTWTANNIYYLKAQVYVKDGATLTIEPGTVVRGDSSNPSCALIVTKGSKLIANGTVNNPIVFTSDKAAGSRTSGDWGGLVLLGKGNYNKTSGLANIEGITISADTQYGGGATPDDTDNSGSLKYVRIEFPGYELAVDKEINGLTFGAVGSGTTVDYVQVSYSKDDAFEWFGGAVNCKHLVALASLDDDLDTDNGFSGKVQFCLVVRDPNRADKSNSEAFESDNNDSKTGATTDGNAGTPKTSATFSNCTLVGPNFRATLPNGLAVNAFHKGGAHIRRNTELKILNSVFMDFKEGLHVDNAYTEANATAGTMKFQNNILAGMTTNYKLNTGSTFDITTWAATNNNTTQVSSADLLTKAYDTDGLVYTGLDYRPATGSALLSGASFADFSSIVSIAAPGVSNVAYDRGATAVALTATTTDSAAILNWYTVPTAGTASATAPTPATSTIGSTTYYVSQTISGVESARAAIVVTVNAIPLPAPVIANKTFCKGDVSTFDSVYAAFGTTLKYFTTETGKTAMTGIALMPSTSTAGTKTYWVLQTDGTTSSPRSSFTVTNNALPATPSALVLTNDAAVLPATSTTAIKAVGVYVGQDVTLKLTATAVGAVSYIWTLPAGVTLADGTTTGTVTSTEGTINVKFSASNDTSSLSIAVKSVSALGCNSVAKVLTLTRASSVAPANIKMNNGVTTSSITSFDKYMGTDTVLRLTAAKSATATSYVWELPTGVTRVTGLSDLTPIADLETTSTDIFVTFKDVTKANTYTYLTTGSAPVETNVLRIGVYGKNGTGLSSKVNSTLTSPTTTSTATLITLKAVAPKATTTIKSLDGLVTASNLSVYLGTETPLTLTCTAVANASSYEWILPAGVNLVSATSNTNTITVNYAGVIPGTAAIVVGVKAINGMGLSPVKELTLTAGAPSTPTVTGSLAICPSATSDVVYTIATLATRATDYFITAPAGATINGGGNTATIDAVAGATFTVNYPSGFISTTAAPLFLNIASVNGFGNNLANRALKLTNTGAVCVSRVASSSVANEFNVVAYPNPSSSEFTIETSAKGAINVNVYDMQGRLVEKSTSTQVGSNLAKGIYNVIVNQGAKIKSVRVIKN